MTRSRLLKGAIVVGACGTVGAIAGITGSLAAPSDSDKSPGPRFDVAVKGPVRAAAGPGALAFKIGAGGPPVHSTEVVPNKAGDGFDTVTHDSGKVKSISGDRITITEGTDKATYGTPTLTIPADATILRNFKEAKLSDIQVGDHVDVSRSSGGTTDVFAVDSQHWPPKPPDLPGSAKPGALQKPAPPPDVSFGTAP
jgi:hypothetical protein